jgi:hypothetical protein
MPTSDVFGSEYFDIDEEDRSQLDRLILPKRGRFNRDLLAFAETTEGF